MYIYIVLIVSYQINYIYSFDSILSDKRGDTDHAYSRFWTLCRLSQLVTAGSEMIAT